MMMMHFRLFFHNNQFAILVIDLSDFILMFHLWMFQHRFDVIFEEPRIFSAENITNAKGFLQRSKH